MTVAPNCNTFTTTGFNLQDLPKIRASVSEAVRLRAQDPSYTDFPSSFTCSHCGRDHALTPEEIRDGLFRGPGQVDFVASYNEYLAAINGIPAAEVGSGFTNGVATNADVEISRVINPVEVVDTPVDPDPVEEDLSPDIEKDDQEIVTETGGS